MQQLRGNFVSRENHRLRYTPNDHNMCQVIKAVVSIDSEDLKNQTTRHFHRIHRTNGKVYNRADATNLQYCHGVWLEMSTGVRVRNRLRPVETFREG